MKSKSKSASSRAHAPRRISLLVCLGLLLALVSWFGLSSSPEESPSGSDVSVSAVSAELVSSPLLEGFDPAAVSPYSGLAATVVHDNIPYFTAGDYPSESWEFYSDLDALGRCGPAMACIGTDLMPTEERGEIGSVKPTGWHLVKYDCVEGKYLYNRCHLLAYSLTGENANVQNLITGTRYLNVQGMLPYERQTASYVEDTGRHVLYRVTPIFSGDNLLADGVLMEAVSVEDHGATLQFCVYCYNVQPGVDIDYATGDSRELPEDG
jgi:DNA-entry nuclease